MLTMIALVGAAVLFVFAATYNASKPPDLNKLRRKHERKLKMERLAEKRKALERAKGYKRRVLSELRHELENDPHKERWLIPSPSSLYDTQFQEAMIGLRYGQVVCTEYRKNHDCFVFKEIKEQKGELTSC